MRIDTNVVFTSFYIQLGGISQIKQNRGNINVFKWGTNLVYDNYVFGDVGHDGLNEYLNIDLERKGQSH